MKQLLSAMLLVVSIHSASGDDVWVFRFLDALGADQDFEAALRGDGEAWAPGLGASYNWNKGAHYVDADPLALADGRVEGVLNATVMPGPWRPGDRRALPLTIELAGAAYGGPAGADRLAGQYEASFEDRVRSGCFVAVRAEAVGLTTGAPQRFELELLRAIPKRERQRLPGADLHLSVALDEDGSAMGEGRTHNYKVVQQFPLGDAMTLAMTEDTLEGEVRFDLPPRDGKPAGASSFTIEARRVGKYIAGTFRGAVSGGVEITGPVSGVLVEDTGRAWAASPGDGLLDGLLEFADFVGPITGDTVRYGVYLPPGYHRSKRRYAVIYHLHGTGCDETSDAGIAARHLEKAMRDGLIEPVILVFPNGYKNSCWADSKSSHKRAYTNVVRELIPRIDAEYRTVATRESRGVMGMSMGGGGAVLLATMHPELFSAVTAWDGAIQTWESLNNRPSANKVSEIFENDPAYFARYSAYHATERNADRLRRDTAIRLVVGELLLAMNQDYLDKLRSLNIPLDYHETGCSHSLDAMMKRLRSESFAWFGRTLATGN